MKTNFFKNLEAGLCSTLSEIYETPITPNIVKDCKKLEAVLEKKRRERWESQAQEREHQKIALMKEAEESKRKAEERLKKLQEENKELEAQLKKLMEKSHVK